MNSSILSIIATVQTTAGQAVETAEKVGLWQHIQNYFIDFLEWLYKLTETIGFPNWVLAIFLFTLVVKVITQPLMNKQMRSSRKMQLLQPEVEQIKRRYATNPQRMNQATMDLYREHGASPTAGCLPMLVQMPILIALFQAIRTYTPTDPAMLANFNFFWIKDLANPDPTIILPLLVAGSTLLQQWATSSKVKDRQMMMMMIMMPVMFFFFSRSFPALMCFYWIFYSLVGVLITWPLLRKWAKEDKRKIEAARAAKEAEESARRERRAAAAAKRAQGKKQAAKKKPNYVVAAEDFDDEDDEDVYMEEFNQEEFLHDLNEDVEQAFKRWLRYKDVTVRRKKMKLHPYSAEETMVNLAYWPDGKEADYDHLRRMFMQERANLEQAQKISQSKFGKMFGMGKTYKNAQSEAGEQSAADRQAEADLAAAQDSVAPAAPLEQSVDAVEVDSEDSRA